MSVIKKNTPFVQLADPDGIKAMRALSAKNPNAASLFYLMMQYIDQENCLIASRQVLASKMQCSTKTIQRSVKYLKEHRYIDVFRTGTSNVYTLNSDIVWKADGERRASALLQGKVLLDLDEQDEQTQTKVRRGFKQLELIK